MTKVYLHKYCPSSLFILKCSEHFFSAYNLALKFFVERIFAQKLLAKCCWNWLQQVSISSTFYLSLFCAKKFQSQYLTIEKMRKTLSYKKFARKMLMKLTTAGRRCRETWMQSSIPSIFSFSVSTFLTHYILPTLLTSKKTKAKIFTFE